MKKFVLIALLLFVCIQNAFSQNSLSNDQRMQWWREARFGMFIHWVYIPFLPVLFADKE